MYALEDSNRDNWLLTLQTQQVPHAQIEMYADCFTDEEWESISSNQILTEEFIIRFRNELDWTRISKYQMLSESFIEKEKDRINFKELGSHNYISVDFIKRYGFRNYSKNYLMTFKSWNLEETEYIVDLLKEVVGKNSLHQGAYEIGDVSYEINNDDIFSNFINTVNVTLESFDLTQRKLPFNFPHNIYNRKVSEVYQNRLKNNMGILKEKYDIWA